MTDSILIKNGTLVTVDRQDRIVKGDLLVKNGRIEQVGGLLEPEADTEVIDASGCAVLPGFVQTHIHLCQTLFRGFADDLSLLDWLKHRVWPMEASHTRESLRASARLGVAEMIKGGTTCALTMETVNFTEEVFKAVDESGFRAVVGKCMMDKGEDVPSAMKEQTEDSIAEALSLIDKWHGHDDGRIRCCFAPRFALSCTKELLQRVSQLAIERGVMVHTHASENRQEIEMVQAETGLRNIQYLDSVGISGRHVVLAHCVHLDEDEMVTMEQRGTHVAHCPSSNLKLGSGIAQVAKMLDRGISVSLGADGAPCSNRLDMFTEMRLAALLQKVTVDATALPALRALRLATIDGARALSLDQEIGSLEEGKRADVTILDLRRLHNTPKPPDVVSAIVYSAHSADVRSVMVNGRWLLLEGLLTTLDESEVIKEANEQSHQLVERANALVPAGN
jgi:5-methylthioadenosine/S-adenosylhomocysteine deaminase